jgi:hypothetical protein
MKYPLKLIEWSDAFNGNHDWFIADTLPETIEPFIVQTFGFEVQRTATHVTLAMSFSNRNHLCDLFTIPLAMIVREQTFRVRRTLKEEGISR